MTVSPVRWCGPSFSDSQELGTDHDADGHLIYLFAGSDRGGERAAAMYSLIETAKLNGVDPEANLWVRGRKGARVPFGKIGEG